MSWCMKRTTEGDGLSQILPRLAEGEEERISIGDIVSRLENRAHTTLLVLFALPNVLPALPGTSAITGMPLVYLALQLTLGQQPWLPKFIANRSFSRAGLAVVIDQAKPWLECSERFLHPRLGALERASGASNQALVACVEGPHRGHNMQGRSIVAAAPGL